MRFAAVTSRKNGIQSWSSKGDISTEGLCQCVTQTEKQGSFYNIIIITIISIISIIIVIIIAILVQKNIYVKI